MPLSFILTASVPFASLINPVRPHLEAVDRVIARHLSSEIDLINQVSQHITQNRGKRLRSVLMMLIGQCCGSVTPQHHTLAAVIEFIHTATLLHDDVIDNSELRRGHATANTLFGNTTSILVGDFIYSRAFQMMVSLNQMRIMSIMADTTNLIAEGEVLQLMHCRNTKTTEAIYWQIIYCKTARLFETTALLGAMACQADPATEVALTEYGRRLGTAFQVIDDVLDFDGKCAETGKNLGNDLIEGKPTLPLIYAMQQGTPTQQRLLGKALESGSRDDIPQVIDIMHATGAIQYARQCALNEVVLARSAISMLPESPHKNTLLQLLEFITERTF